MQFVKEILTNLCATTCKEYEVVIVDAGSNEDCALIIEDFSSKISINYTYVNEVNIPDAKRLAVSRAQGQYLIFIGTDTILPPEYLSNLDDVLDIKDADIVLGGIKNGKGFTDVQRGYYFTSRLPWINHEVVKELPFNLRPSARELNLVVKKSVVQDDKVIAALKYNSLTIWSELRKSGYQVKISPRLQLLYRGTVGTDTIVKSMFNLGLSNGRIFGKNAHLFAGEHIIAAFTAIAFLFTVLMILPLSLAVLLPWLAVLIFLVIDTLVNTKHFLTAITSVWATSVSYLAYGFGYSSAIFTLRPVIRKKGSARVVYWL